MLPPIKIKSFIEAFFFAIFRADLTESYWLPIKLKLTALVFKTLESKPLDMFGLQK